MNRVLLFILFIAPFGAIGQNARDSRQLLQELDFAQLPASFFLQTHNLEPRTRQPLDPAVPVELTLRPGKLEFDHATPFIAFSAAWEEERPDAENTRLWVSFSSDETNWSEWQVIEPDPHAVEIRHSFASELYFLEPGIRYYRIRIRANETGKGMGMKKLLVNFFSPGQPLKEEPGSPIEHTALAPDTCALPVVVTRAQWNCPQTVTSHSKTTVTHLIVHHAAGPNTSSDWGATVLSIWNYHVNTNGWADVGYNWLIAPNGQLFEGRGGGDNIVGAHFCGKNSGTMGICMLGTYTSVQITDAARKTLTDVLAWKASKLGLDPLGKSYHATSALTLDHVSGHRDGCSTECPGTQLYSILPEIRIAVKERISSCNLITALPEIPGLDYLEIAPNPAGAGEAAIRLSLRYPSEVGYRIFSPEGRLVAESAPATLQGETRLPLSGLNGVAPGLYQVQVWIDNQLVVRKLALF
ncbi:MAG: hypothetical protein KIPDCIKN_01330 [Haliscomenobacter sp.]|nr:hypothetical protein [Haliscomenobacter sp.]